MTDSTTMRALAERLRERAQASEDYGAGIHYACDDAALDRKAAAALAALAAERDELDSKLLDSRRWALCETERADRAETARDDLALARDALAYKLAEMERNIAHYREVESLSQAATFTSLVPVTHREVELERQLGEADAVIVDMYGEAPTYGVPGQRRDNIVAAFERHAGRPPAS